MPFSPSSLPGLVLWARPGVGAFQDSALTTPAASDGDPVGGWQDQSGLNHHIIQTNTAKRGVLKLGVQNGNPTVRFDGISQFLKSAFTLNQPCTVIAVVRYTSGAAGNDLLSGAATDVELQHQSGSVRGYAGSFGSATTRPLTDGRFGVVQWVLNGAASSLAVNRGTPVVDNFGSTNPGGVALGAYNNGTSGCACDFGEVVIYSRALSGTELTSLLGYLNGEWGVFDPNAVAPVFNPIPNADTWDHDKTYFRVLRFGAADYRMWYIGVNPTASLSGLAYATSTDGVSWSRPTLNQVTYSGSTANNLLYAYSTNGHGPLYNPSAPTGKKFLINLEYWPPNQGGIKIIGSEDGVTGWTDLKTVVTTQAFTPFHEGKGLALRADGRICAYYSSGHAANIRSIGYWLSDTTDPAGTWTDMGHCTGLVAPDGDHQFYALDVYQLAPSNWLGMVSRYNVTTGAVDFDLWRSADEGASWTQLAAAWIPRGADGDWDSTVIFGGWPVQVGSEWRVYYTGGSTPHNAPDQFEQIGYKVASALAVTPFAVGSSHVFSVASAPGAVWGGTFGTGTDSGFSYRHPLSDSRLDFVATGTACSLANVFANTAGFQWSVDGGAPQAYAGLASVWNPCVLFTGLSDGPHTVRFTFTTAFIDVNSFLSVTGAAPAVSSPAGMSGNVYFCDPTNPWMTVDGSMDYSANYGGQPCYRSATTSADGSIRFKGKISGIQVYDSYPSANQRYHVAVDGVDSGVVYATPLRTNATTLWGWTPLGSAYDGSADHEYRVTGTGGALVTFSQVMAVGGTPDLAALAPLPAWCFVGDSITNGQIPTADNALAHPYLVSLAKSVGARNLGVTGSTVFTLGSSQAAAVVALSPAPARVVILYGVNDAANVVAGTETVGQFQAAYQSMLQTIINGLPAATPIDCLTYLDCTGAQETVRASMQAAQLAAINACTNHGAVRHVVTDGWITPNTDGLHDTITDGLHPNAAGYQKVKARYLASFAAPPVAPVVPSFSQGKAMRWLPSRGRVRS